MDADQQAEFEKRALEMLRKKCAEGLAEFSRTLESDIPPLEVVWVLAFTRGLQAAQTLSKEVEKELNKL